MTEHYNDASPSGWGLAATVKLCLSIVVIIIASAGVLLVLDIISLDVFKYLSIKIAMIGGIALVTGVILGLLARPKK